MKKTFVSLYAFVIVLVLAGLVSAHAGDDESLHHTGCAMMGGMMTGTYGITGILFGWFFGLLIIVALVLLIVWLVKQIQKK